MEDYSQVIIPCPGWRMVATCVQIFLTRQGLVEFLMSRYSVDEPCCNYVVRITIGVSMSLLRARGPQGWGGERKYLT